MADELELLNRWSASVNSISSAIAARGERYRTCTFDTYECTLPKQTEAVSRLRDYASDSASRIAAGQNIILYGPKGSGKDHLATALAKECGVWSLAEVHWVNGCDLLDLFHAEVTSRTSRLFPASVASLSKAKVLWISDPLPPVGQLSDFQQSAFFSLLDARYSNLRPTWITCNVASADELSNRLGAQSTDRLRHGALAIHCNWPSYRTSK